MTIIKSESLEYKGCVIRARVSAVKGNQWHALVTIESHQENRLVMHGFVEVPPASSREKALRVGWEAAKQEIDLNRTEWK